jgi:predicted RNA-binding protein with TRAM domain
MNVRYENMRGNPIPVKEGEEYEVEIEAVGEKGDGIAKVNGFVLFVPETSKGDRVRIRVTRVLKTVGFAEVVSKVEGAPAEEKPEPAKEEPAEEVAAEEPGEEPQEPSEDFGEEEPEGEPQEEPDEEPAEEEPQGEKEEQPDTEDQSDEESEDSEKSEEEQPAES